MAVRLSDKWLWDFWFAQDGPDYHIFYLQAPRSLGDSEQRHWHATIGHAVSQDLKSWRVLPDALGPDSDNPRAWDNYTTWTGSVIRHEDRWYLFYTGGNRDEKGLIQRIGLATSTDLIRWERHPGNPAIVADPHWYELLNLDLWHDQAWRDPWVFWLPDDNRFHALITTRSNSGSTLNRGVFGHAYSTDLVAWTVDAPLDAPADFGYMEVPQLVQIGDLWYLLFSVDARSHSTQRIKRTGKSPVTGTHYLVSEHPLGPFRYLDDDFLISDGLYSGKLIQAPDGEWVALAFHASNEAGEFVGEIVDPIPIRVEESGRLTVAAY